MNELLHFTKPHSRINGALYLFGLFTLMSLFLPMAYITKSDPFTEKSKGSNPQDNEKPTSEKQYWVCWSLGVYCLVSLVCGVALTVIDVAKLIQQRHHQRCANRSLNPCRG